MKKNILLIDDDKIFNFLSEKTIASLGFANEIHFALNGKQALEILQRYKAGKIGRPDLIFLDLDMPIMDGYEFMDAFDKLQLPDKEHITIVVLTSSADPRDLARVQEMGVKYYFNKPLKEDEIKRLISQEFSYQLN